MWCDFTACIAAVASDPSLRALVICGGPEAFVSGADIADFRAFSAAPDALVYEGVVETALGALEALDIATIAAIAGACTGGGAILACTCDVRIGLRTCVSACRSRRTSETSRPQRTSRAWQKSSVGRVWCGGC